jgi:hypothetical protein
LQALLGQTVITYREQTDQQGTNYTITGCQSINIDVPYALPKIAEAVQTDRKL